VAPTLAEVLARASAITSVKYDSTVNRPGTPVVSMKIREKGNKFRIETTEQGTSIVILSNGDTRTVYRYTPSQNTAERMPYPSQARTALGAVSILKSCNAAASGTAVIDGKNCLIVTPGTDATVRMWLWQDYGIPLLLEETSTAGKTTIEFRNLDFTDIPASSFDLPQGVRVTGGGPPAP
jgi:outer membrane lipoprotein-sorting protein